MIPYQTFVTAVSYRYILPATIASRDSWTSKGVSLLTQPEGLPIDIGQLLERFPGNAALVARLLVENDSFRHACEDFLLASATLTQLEGLQERPEHSKITEYREMIAGLESEIAAALQRAKPTP